jgi:ribonucleoside-diphosphate reductase subunit M1
MYYLRTMAASAPIQFTVDQAALQQVDTAVATKPTKKRATRPIPAPMMEKKVATNGTVTPTSEEEDAHVGKLTVVNGNGTPKATPKNTGSVVNKKPEEMDEVERGIYDEKVIACSLEVLTNSPTHTQQPHPSLSPFFAAVLV